MRDVHLSEAAKTDLIDIWTESFQQWGPDQADSYLEDIGRALNGLVENPRMGMDCSDLMHGARRLISGRHVVFYEIGDDTIFVIRVLHQSMDVRWHLRPS